MALTYRTVTILTDCYSTGYAWQRLRPLQEMEAQMSECAGIYQVLVIGDEIMAMMEKTLEQQTELADGSIPFHRSVRVTLAQEQRYFIIVDFSKDLAYIERSVEMGDY